MTRSRIVVLERFVKPDGYVALIIAFAQRVLAAPAAIGDADFELTCGFNLVAGIHAPAEALAELTPR